MKKDAETRVLVARIECVALRDALHSQPARADADPLADTRRRFNQARESLRSANYDAMRAGLTVPILPYPTHDLQTPFYVRELAMWADYESSMPPPSVTTICRSPGCTARGHVHRQTDTAPPAEGAAP
jgi:hypothetical protein